MPPRKRYITYRNTAQRYWDLYRAPYPGPQWYDDYRSAMGVHDLQISEGHRYQDLGKDDSSDIGGDFLVRKQEYSEDVNPDMHLSTSWGNPYAYGDHYHGPQYARRESVSLSDSIWPSPSVSTPAELAVLGTQAIARVIPTNPLAGLTVALGELKREGIPNLIGAQSLRQRSQVARNAGSEYLNVQFGWAPLLRDVQSIAHSVRKSKELEEQYVRNSGKRLKRRYSFPVIESNTSTVVDESFTALPVPRMHTYFYQDCTPIVTRHRYERIERWFSGCFTYYLPPNKGLARSAAVANKLYGTRITPETLWNLTPWSWAADWIGNFGDVVHNVSAFMSDGLVMPYAYMMETSTITDTYVASGTRYTSYPNDLYTTSQTFTTTVKQRIKATPFGFGLLDADFTQRQWSILAALGITLGGKKAGH